MYGARPIKRWVQKNIMISISKMLVKGEADKGSTIFIDAAIDWKGLEFRVVKRNNNVDAGGKRNTYD